jgi:hypothetical protein
VQQLLLCNGNRQKMGFVGINSSNPALSGHKQTVITLEHVLLKGHPEAKVSTSALLWKIWGKTTVLLPSIQIIQMVSAILSNDEGE